MVTEAQVKITLDINDPDPIGTLKLLQSHFQQMVPRIGLNKKELRVTEFTVTKAHKNSATGEATVYSVETTDEVSLAVINFHKGPILDVGVNGIQMEDLIAICIDRLTDFQAGPFACEPNQVALDHLRQALNALDVRTAERKARGVFGKLEK